ncbi:MAG TPA: SCP2 sterol-binding domain-containing protein [Anaerolineales bacterium]|nr:SCP2 sterol-binding domain-containing protein [Anaerolineales bacterium]
MSDLTIEQIMTNTPKVFKASAAEGVNTVVQFNFTGAEAAQWFVTIQNGTCASEKGTSGSPNMTMTIDSQDYIDIISGKMNAMNAFMQGKVKVSGDMMMAMKFPTFFDMRG